MGWFGSTVKFLSSPITGGQGTRPPAPVAQHGVPRHVWARAITPGRASWDSSSQWIPVSSGGFGVVVPPPDAETNWRVLNLDRRTLDALPPAELQKFVAELSPEVSKAIWDWLRFMNPGYEIYAVKPGTDDRDKNAQVKLDAIVKRLSDRYVTLDVLINRLHKAQFLRGALLTEAVFARDRRTLLDIATPDPAVVRFRVAEDPDIPGALKFVLCQWQNGKLIDLPEETVKYVPLDPLPGSPYGSAPVAPALFTALFLLSMLRDLKRVVQQQGYSRIDVSVLVEKLQAMIPEDARDDPAEVARWVEGATQEVADALAALEPDDAYVHADGIVINRPVGTVDAASLGGTEALIRGLERMAVRALKSAAFLLGSQESTTETQSVRQYEAFAQAVRASQHMSEALLGYDLTLALNADGTQAEAKVKFAENRSSEELRDAQVRQIKQKNAIESYWMGFDNYEDAGQEATGHAPDAKEPRLEAAAYGFIGGKGQNPFETKAGAPAQPPPAEGQPQDGQDKQDGQAKKDAQNGKAKMRGHWVTIGGNHVFIGEPGEDAGGGGSSHTGGDGHANADHPAPGIPSAVHAELTQVPHTNGQPDADGTLAHPIAVGANLDLAVKLLAEGKHIRLDQPVQAATLVQKLGDMANDATDKGKNAPIYDLGLVTISGTNLFTQDSKGIPRARMPQLQGEAIPGTPAAAPEFQDHGEANLVGAFAHELEHLGYDTRDRTVPATTLRATQLDLDGKKVAKLVSIIDQGKLREESIVVSKDRYIIDGHHRWAAKVAVDLRDNHPGDIVMPVRQVNADIGTLLDLTSSFTSRMGLKNAGLNAALSGTKGTMAALRGLLSGDFSQCVFCGEMLAGDEAGDGFCLPCGDLRRAVQQRRDNPKLTPHGEPLAETPPPPAWTEIDRQRLATRWDALMAERKPNAVGLLRARHVR